MCAEMGRTVDFGKPLATDWLPTTTMKTCQRSPMTKRFLVVWALKNFDAYLRAARRDGSAYQALADRLKHKASRSGDYQD